MTSTTTLAGLSVLWALTSGCNATVRFDDVAGAAGDGAGTEVASPGDAARDAEDAVDDAGPEGPGDAGGDAGGPVDADDDGHADDHDGGSDDTSRAAFGARARTAPSGRPGRPRARRGEWAVRPHVSGR
jgi:hypothetical protein